MKKLISLAAIAVFALGTQRGVFTQAVNTSRLAWDQDAPTLEDAQSYTYKYYPDSSTTGIILKEVTCTGTATPFQCSVPFPAFTPGKHTIQLSASNIAGEGTKSSVFSFTFVVVPSAPANIRIIGG